jgi:adenylate cyclase
MGGLFVIARNPSFTYKGRAVDVKQMSRCRIRIAAQLIGASTGAHVSAAERFDATLDDVFDLQGM